MRRTTTLTAAGLVGLALLTPTSAATAAGETCRGEAATIVGAPGTRIIGTEGRDVIVTNRSRYVESLGGDDLICITGPDQRTGYSRDVDLDAGPGNDVVDGTAAPDWPAYGRLGAGADTFYGGAGDDRVEAGSRSADFRHVDRDHDVLVGGRGSDSFTSGEAGQPNTDVVDLGGGHDHLNYGGQAAGGSSVAAGAGSDVLSLSTSAHALVIDNSIGRLTEDGRPSLPWTDMESFSVWTDHEDPLDLTFWGTGADETVTSSAASALVRASMRGGEDVFIAGSMLLDGSTLTGGAQRDLLHVTDRDRDLSLDLQKKAFATSEGTTTHRSSVMAFESAELHARSAVLKGDSGHNELGVSACEGTVRGRGGNDVLRRTYDSWSETGPDCRERYTMDGGSGADELAGYGGNDVLRGGTGNDVLEGRAGVDKLLGGKGHDRADGGPDRPDRCVAERKRRCER